MNALDGASSRPARIAILQPTFLPWLGWFDIADQVDLLILLDDVAFSKQSWQQRNRIRTGDRLALVTVPVVTAGRLGQPICQVALSDTRFAAKLERTLSGSYARAPFFRALFPGFQETLQRAAGSGNLSDLNSGLIEWFMDVLGIPTPVRRSSTLDAQGRRGEYLVALCQHVGATNYLSPAGSEAYLLEDRACFEQQNIKVALHEFAHPEYRQVFDPFIPYASTLDLLFNEGPRSLEIIRSGRRPNRHLGVRATAGVDGGVYDKR